MRGEAPVMTKTWRTGPSPVSPVALVLPGDALEPVAALERDDLGGEWTVMFGFSSIRWIR